MTFIVLERKERSSPCNSPQRFSHFPVMLSADRRNSGKADILDALRSYVRYLRGFRNSWAGNDITTAMNVYGVCLLKAENSELEDSGPSVCDRRQ